MTAALTASDVVAGALQVVAELKAQLLEDSATARRAETSAEDAIGAFEKEVTLLSYEVKRQRQVAADRNAREAEAKAAADRKAAADLKARHETTLRREAKRQADLKAATAYTKNRSKEAQ